LFWSALANFELATEGATEARNLAATDGDGEFRLLLESAVTETTGASSGGVAVERLPNAAAAAAAASAEPPQVLNVSEILKRNHVPHAEAKLVKELLENMLLVTSPTPSRELNVLKSYLGTAVA
jgi:hypothetical protein